MPARPAAQIENSSSTDCAEPLLHGRPFKLDHRVAVFSAGAEAQRLQEKKYLYDTLYTCGALELEHTKAEEVIKELFEFWVNSPEELPESYVDDVKSEGLARVVADYIAGMTDNFILLQYAEVRRRVRLGRVPFPERR